MPVGFDKVSFVRYMKNIGGRYSNQAIELISICRDIQAHKQSRESDVRLRGTIEVADAALQAAVDAWTGTSTKADEKFEEASNVLVAFEMEFSSAEPVSDRQRDSIASRMATARARDKSRLNHRNLASNQRLEERVVEFVLFRFLPDNKPIVVQQVLDNCSSLQEVLWNFSRLTDEKRLTLGQNPHFYKHLYTSRDAYGKKFRLDPIEDFRDENVERFYVLTDRPGRIYIPYSSRSLAFGNVWAPRDAIIFKDVRGKLCGEDIIRPYIDTLNLRYCLLGPVSTSDALWRSAQDWRELIPLMVNSHDISILIGAIPLGSSRALSLPHSSTYRSSPDSSPPVRRGHSDGISTSNVPRRQGTQEGAITEETRILFQGLYVEGSTSSSVQPPSHRR